MNKLAVIQVVPELDTGGAERTTVDVANALAHAGWSSIVVSQGGRMQTELDQRVKHVVLPVAAKNPFTMARNAGEIAKLAKAQGASLIHARSRACAWSAMMAANARKIPWVATYHGIYNARNFLKRFYNSIMVRADAVIANSEWTAAHIRETYKQPIKRLTVIPRGIDVVRFNPAEISRERVGAVRAGWNVRVGERVILLPGRMARWKGQLVFVDAVARLKADGRLPENVRAVMAGDAQSRFEYADEVGVAMAEKGVASVALMAGHVDDMPAAYAASDIVVSASTDPEAFGRVAAEAGAMARPVIATDHGGARETVIAGVSGLLVQPGDPVALANALADILARRAADLFAMGNAARAHIRANYTVERMCTETLGLYARVMGDAVTDD